MVVRPTLQFYFKGILTVLDRFRRLLPPISLKTLSSLDAYAQWAANYPPRAHNTLMQVEEAAMRKLMPDLNGQVVLDLACGTGRYGLLARDLGAKQVIGLDNSRAMLEANPQRQIALATSEAIPMRRQSVNVVLCGLALGHLPSLKPTLHEINRILKSGGVALISDFHPFVFLSGGQRTFTASDGLTYAVEHHAHLYADYHRASRESDLWIEDVMEASIEMNNGANTPIVIIYRLCKS
jgi:malonyl-CoA O-methyltransferase